MRSLSTREIVWGSVTAIAIGVLGTLAYLFAPRPQAPIPTPDPSARNFDAAGEERRAKQLPEYDELRNLYPHKGYHSPSPEAFARVVVLTQHQNWWIRFYALCLLGNTTGPLQNEAIACVRPFLKDENWFLRYQAIIGLGRLKAKECIPDLVAFLQNGDRNEQHHARQALKNIGHPIE